VRKTAGIREMKYVYILTTIIVVFVSNLLYAQPTDFSLIAPSNSSEDVDVWPDFIWESSFDSSGVIYSLQIGSTPLFSQGTFIDYDSLTDTIIKPGVDLAMNSLYYWRVLAISGNGDTVCCKNNQYPINFWQLQTIPSSESREVWAVEPLPYNRTLITENSPYIIKSGNLIIPAGKCLKVQKGITVQIEGDYSIAVHGRIEMWGTNSDSIYVTTSDETPVPGDWGYIAFYNAEPAQFDTNWSYISGSAFEYVNFNYSGSDTSTIWSDRTSIYVAHCSFVDNSNYSAIKINYGSGSYIFSNSIRDYSHSNGGGGIDCYGSYNRIQSNTIINCQGGVGIDCSYDHNQILSNYIRNCNGVHSGGGMRINGNGHRIIGNTVINCFAEDNSDTYGGGICFRTVNTGDRSIIAENYICSCYVRSSNGGTAGGGGIYIVANEDSIINNIISQNHCESNGGICYGGGLFEELGNNNIIRGNTLSENYFLSGSVNYGGGMAFNTCNSDTLISNIIINNDAGDGYGGGIYHNGKIIYIDSCIISGNLSGNGGGIYQFTDGIINRCIITNNEASQEGGGIHGNNLSGIYNSIVKYNSAADSLSGGGIYGHSHSINFCNLSHNFGFDIRNTGDSIDATNNWWFTRSDEIAIEGYIWDGYDTQGALGIVTYQPFLTDVSDSTPVPFSDAYYITPMEDATYSSQLVSIINENDTIYFELAGNDNNPFSRDVAVITVINWNTLEFIRPFYEETGDSSGIWQGAFYLDSITVLPDRLAVSLGDRIEVSVERDPSVQSGFIVGQSPTFTEEERLLSPERFYLGQNYPNPFNPTTTILYELKKRSDVAISIYNLLGQNVYTFTSTSVPAGTHTIYWNGKDFHGNRVSSGVYFYRIEAGDFVDYKKMILLK